MLRTPGVHDHPEKGPLLDHDSGKAHHHVSRLPKDRDQGGDPGGMLGHQQLLDGPPQQMGTSEEPVTSLALSPGAHTQSGREAGLFFDQYFNL